MCRRCTLCWEPVATLKRGQATAPAHTHPGEHWNIDNTVNRHGWADVGTGTSPNRRSHKQTPNTSRPCTCPSHRRTACRLPRAWAGDSYGTLRHTGMLTYSRSPVGTESLRRRSCTLMCSNDGREDCRRLSAGTRSPYSPAGWAVEACSTCRARRTCRTCRSRTVPRLLPPSFRTATPPCVAPDTLLWFWWPAPSGVWSRSKTSSCWNEKRLTSGILSWCSYWRLTRKQVNTRASLYPRRATTRTRDLSYIMQTPDQLN